MTILIAGATGFLGSYLLKSLIKRSYKIIALKRSTSDTYRLVKYLDEVTFYDIDKVELSKIFKDHKIDLVINTVTNYGRKDSKISCILESNLIFGLKLLEESLNSNLKAFINTDTLLERNINAYALSKAQLEDWMKFLQNSRNTKIINVKIEHMYGPLDDENKFVYWLINQLKQNVEKIDLTSGDQKRDFIYIDDVISAYEIIINKIDSLSNYEVFELGSGNSIEVKNFVKQIVEVLKKSQNITTQLNLGVIPFRENENMDMQADITKLVELGWKPKLSIEDGIKNIFKLGTL